MKNKILLIFFCSLLLASCSLDSDNTTNEDTQEYEIQWHLTEVNGGIAGVSHQFDLNLIIWVFDNNDTVDNDSDDILTIVNDNTDDTKEDFLDSGTYSYSILEDDTIFYLSIDGTEYGEYNFPSSTSLLVDTNELSTGSGTDGFTYTFQRVLVAID